MVSGPASFKTGSEGAPQTGSLYPNAKVEPWVAVNPQNSKQTVGVWQQDRYSNGGARGLLAAVSFNGRSSWQVSMAPFSRCSGGNAQNGGDYERASDPCVTFSPNGDVYQIANAVLVSKSTDGGKTWSNPVTLIRDTSPTAFNDQESITADPNDSRFVYAVWDRLVFPSEEARGRAPERAIGFRGPAWFARTTDGGQTWEAPRIIFDPGEVNQTVVRPQGELINLFDLIYNAKNARGVRGFNIAVIRSADRGFTWYGPIIISKQVLFDVVRNPTPVSRCGPPTSCPTLPSTRTVPTFTSSGRTSGSARPGPTTSPSPCPPTAASPGLPRSGSTRHPSTFTPSRPPFT